MREISSASHSVSFNGGGGYSIYYQEVPHSAIDTAMRHIQLDIVSRGLPTALMREWMLQGSWFPHLRWDDEITQLAKWLPFDVDEMRKKNRMCDPQIVVQFPQGDDYLKPNIEKHVDTEPHWAGVKKYCDIFMVPLTKQDYRNGGINVWRDNEVHNVELNPGDLFRMQPETVHSGGLNETGFIRYAVYFRFLEG